MAISQHDTMSIVIILELHRMQTVAVEISQHQFSICQKANGQFCNINAPLATICQPSILHHSPMCQEHSKYHH